MSTYTEDDLRAALHSDAARCVDADDTWVILQRGIDRRRRRRAVTAMVVAIVVTATAVAVRAASTSGHTRRLAVHPASYEEACANEPNVCHAGVTGPIPAALFRPLQPRRPPSGAPCPVTPGVASPRPDIVVGDTYGSVPVRLVIGDRGDRDRGVVELGNPGVPGWFALETVWLVDPGYEGPFIARGSRVDDAGTVSFGADVDHLATTFVEPPAPDPNTHDGYRSPPATVWLRGPGCYVLQLDTLTMSETIVLDVVAPR